jgi:succinate-acetate transporter protein
MFRRIELGPARPHERFAEPSPLGLIGLAIGCAALVPIAFGLALSPAAFETAAVFCLLFGGGCQLVAGLLCLANHNLYGGTLFTAFAFNWALNAWTLHGFAAGRVPDGAVMLAADICMLVVFVVLTYGFGFYSGLLFAFLADIDVLFAFRVAAGVSGTHRFALPIAVLTVALGALSLWLAFALLVNPTAGRRVFPFAGPLFRASAPPVFDAGPRRAVLAALYGHFHAEGLEPLAVGELERRLGASCRRLRAELAYLAERGAVALTGDPATDGCVRLTADGIDFWEQAALGKTQVV